ncbi:MAG TPA: ABC transporter ATP-binding protein [Atribacter sp.]|jgi:putative ABC transport system ATP-binding protein|uniref:ABC transporter ATP-binding protein n=1 Tax=Atribacter sp. TaxID=2847780 RepID=UPI0016BBCF49|nr:ABC transporter ATP-binding protein [Atribacter sp.]MDI9595621.1 ABC transporter ATP-binding protein [Atribacterota bacterium]NLI08087.1 ABC transporter ATP-binding protein [Thermotogaceae bacterium]HHT09913.1 ABC transporter ATP-binding protein [Candidatus Atribacteria bacterium]HOT05471.1 ABC transporter ATP-binding protein [Atribacter sp.]HQK83010.1 ABC transporter ATP-binding protein [Atribacter sp.]
MVSELTKIYRTGSVEVIALKDVSFQVNKDEFIAIMGPSGSGKSTLMYILGCLDRATRGSYYFEGQEVSRLKENTLAIIRNKKIGFVFQTYNLLPRLNAFQNVELPLIYAGISGSQRKIIVKNALIQVGLENRIFHRPNQLSGGESQRVGIARALVNDPTILLADEPTGNLDSKSGEEVMQIFQNLNDQGKMIILVTHEREIAQHTKRILHFLDGKLVGDEPVENPLRASDQLKQISTSVLC